VPAKVIEWRPRELLIAMKEAGERRGAGQPPKDEKNGSSESTVLSEPESVKLEDLGISKDRSSRWQE
jgi:hypothetical protein